MKIVEGSYFNAAINSAGKLVLWTKFNYLNETTIETEIYARDCSFFKPLSLSGRRESYLLYIDNNFELITLWLDPISKTVVQQKDFFVDDKIKRLASLPHKPYFFVIKENGTLKFMGDKYSSMAIPKSEAHKSFSEVVMTDDTVTALTTDGAIVSWGKFEADNIKVPHKYYKPLGSPKILKLFSNKYVTFILKADGSIDGWGNNINKQLDILNFFKQESTTVYDIALNDSLVFISYSSDGSLVPKLLSYGTPNDNLDYSLGDLKDKFNYSSKIPALVYEKLNEGIKIKNLYGGKNSIYALFNDQSVISWGLEETTESNLESINPEAKVFNSIYVPDLFVKETKNFSKRENPSFGSYGFIYPLETMIQKINKKDVSFEDINLEAKLEQSTITLTSGTDKKAITFNIEKEIGAGTYGKVYLLRKGSEPSSLKLVLKVPKSFESGTERSEALKDSLSEFYEEVLKQIIIYNETKERPGGALCGQIICIGKFGSVGTEEEPSVPFVIQEYFPLTLQKYLIETLSHHSEEHRLKNEKIFLQLLRKLCNKLKASSSQVQKGALNFEFNHRDMKSDNIMLTYDGKGNVNDIFLIDFGFSCVNINGYKLGQNNFIFGKTKCFKNSRDLSFLIFSLYYNLKKGGLHFSFEVENFLKWLLSFKIKDEICEPYKGCDYEISDDYTKMDLGSITSLKEMNNDLFTQSYYFFNKNYIENPKTYPENLAVHIENFLNYGMS